MNMNKVIFRCTVCKLPLSAPLVELVDRTKLSAVLGEDYISPGFYVVADDNFANPAGQWVINLGDEQNTMPHTDAHRLQGCCGFSDIHGRNTMCINGHEIGTEFSDCWVLHGLQFDSNCVELENVSI
jgi:hypothetical protein